MKILIVLLAFTLVASPPASSQVFGKKKSKEAVPDPKIDSLTKANQTLTLKADSLSKDLAKHLAAYAVIKEKVFHYNYDPAKMSFLLDSLRSSRDTTAALLSGKASRDSVAVLVKDNKKLKANIDSIKTAWEKSKTYIPAEEAERAKAIGNLRQFKELLDAKIITDAEFLTLKKKYMAGL
jgi:hypothetical protein